MSRTRKYWGRASILAFCAVLPLLMAPTGGLPSRPRFQSVGVGVAPPSAGVIAAATNVTVGGASVCLQNGSNCPAASGASATASGNTSIANALAVSVIALGAEQFDTGNFHDNVTNNSRVILPSATGYASCAGTVSGFTGNTAASTVWELRLFLRKNGTDHIATQSVTAHGGGVSSLNIRLNVANTMIPANGTDYVEMVMQADGFSAASTVTTNTNTTAGVTRLTCVAV